MHVRAELELGAGSGTTKPVVAGIVVAVVLVGAGTGGEKTELGEALADTFELQEAGQEDVDVGFAAAGLVQAFDCGCVHDPHGDVLRDGCFAVAVGTGFGADVVLDTQFRIAVVEAFVELVEMVGLGAGAGETITAESAGSVAGAGKSIGDDCEGKEGNIVSFR